MTKFVINEDYGNVKNVEAAHYRWDEYFVTFYNAAGDQVASVARPGVHTVDVVKEG